VHLHLLTGSPSQHNLPRQVDAICQRSDCGQRAEPIANVESILKALQQARSEGMATASLRDGELLERPEALEILQQTRKIGFNALELWTNGHLLAQAGAAEAIARAGATHIAVPLYGDTSESHDFVTATPGHFARAIAGLRRARAAGLRTVVVVPILRPTFRNLSQIVQKSLAIDVSAFRIIAHDGPDRDKHPLLAPLPLASRYIQLAQARAEAAKKRCTIKDIPLCLLQENVADALREVTKIVTLGDVASEPKAYLHGKPCESCAWRKVCPGQLAGLAAVHGWIGVVARADAMPI